MKKITVFLFLSFVIGSLFAYEPKKEYFKVTKNKVSYYEKVEPMQPTILFFYNKNMKGEDHRSFVISKDYTTEKVATYNYKNLEKLRKSAAWAVTNYNNDCEGWDLKRLASSIRSYIDEAVLYIPFITEENFYSMTEEDYTKLFNDYIQSIRLGE